MNAIVRILNKTKSGITRSRTDEKAWKVRNKIIMKTFTVRKLTRTSLASVKIYSLMIEIKINESRWMHNIRQTLDNC